jgi:hypothetical protein
LRVSGVAACFAGRFLSNGRQQLWLLPPPKVTPSKATSATAGASAAAAAPPLLLRSVSRRGAILDSGRLWLKGVWAPVASLAGGGGSSVSVPRVSLLEAAASESGTGISGNGSKRVNELGLPAGANATLEAVSSALLGQVCATQSKKSLATRSKTRSRMLNRKYMFSSLPWLLDCL